MLSTFQSLFMEKGPTCTVGRRNQQCDCTMMLTSPCDPTISPSLCDVCTSVRHNASHLPVWLHTTDRNIIFLSIFIVVAVMGDHLLLQDDDDDVSDVLPLALGTDTCISSCNILLPLRSPYYPPTPTYPTQPTPSFLLSSLGHESFCLVALDSGRIGPLFRPRVCPFIAGWHFRW